MPSGPFSCNHVLGDNVLCKALLAPATDVDVEDFVVMATTLRSAMPMTNNSIKIVADQRIHQEAAANMVR
jgi:hypothetical protein